MNNQIKALAKHLDIEFFDFNGETYIGNIEDFNSFSGSNYEDAEEIDTENEPFFKWLEENCDSLSDQIEVSSYDDNLLLYSDEEYLVVSDDVADDLWNEDLENYIDECILPELNERYRIYFDRESWKSDAKIDGRAHSLNRYDGSENMEIVGDETFYIYRQN